MAVTHDAGLLQVEQRRPDPEWLARGLEAALEPELPVLDAHHHFSEHWGGYLPQDLLADGQGHDIRATVYVQCGWHYRSDGPEALRPVGETEAVVACSRQANAGQDRTRVAAAIVGYADLRLGEAADAVLAAQVAAGDGRFRGIRNSGAFDPEFRHGVLARPMEHLYADAAFRAGYACLARHGLSFDAWVYHPQLRDVLELAQAFPDTPLILDHVGGLLGVARYRDDPRMAQAEWLPWIRRLAECPNVSVKLGGLGTAVFGFDFSERARPPSSQELAEAWRPAIEPVIESFGAGRCFFESNFPVDRSVAPYGVVWNALKRLAAGASADDKRLLFHDTASRVYRIGSLAEAPAK
ncbi:amidohydrolase family protein [Xylophilus rhododendri]|uniref:Amidohydrolase family protein n=1 Tax=Xylophilus rhododendri TaxID=2697032 RepID=A0A857J3L1_9BURK|nr:amidohydrolase family protein [Xylophilus rhododendri]QHI97468.1 amidohydrolase family protein [Xylophilus rhododendri]